MVNRDNTVCLIGLGEAGSIFARAMSEKAAVRAYDSAWQSDEFRKRTAWTGDAGICLAGSAAEASTGAKLVLSLVTAAASLDVAREAGTYLRPGQILVDLNSVSPGTKSRSAALVERGGAAYVDGAIMAPVPPRGLGVPILLAGAQSKAVIDSLARFPMNLEIVSERIGLASATKMCRSVIIKGIEALCAEAFLSARAHGVEERVLSSLHDTFPGTDWNRFAAYQIGRSLVHGRRRAAEMREVARTIQETGLEPSMAHATAHRQDWAADLSDAHPELKKRSDEDWLRTLDLILAASAHGDGMPGRDKLQ
ncbi:NAD(P)-dependent oxidoreductase [Dongia deserti]|uniref:NAD(P)-dependent oxidoreductase n=1 Tax=Dongia deserti TaxID=2268030 RepID=UPI000E65D1C8|nr:NAD(P)-dependent oxidoreductase [Dongia deserti]